MNHNNGVDNHVNLALATAKFCLKIFICMSGFFIIPCLIVLSMVNISQGKTKDGVKGVDTLR